MARKLRRFLLLIIASSILHIPVSVEVGNAWGGRGFLLIQGLRACGDDIAQLCPNVIPGGGRIIQCLTDKRTHLSPDCRSHVDKTTSLRNSFFACNADAARYCSGVLPGGGRIVACLMDKHDVISPICKKALTRAKDVFGR